jgi:hypothetical protein
MTEGIDPTAEAEEYRQLVRSLNEKVLDKATSAPQWKQRFLDVPEAAMRAAGFSEPQRIEDCAKERCRRPRFRAKRAI